MIFEDCIFERTLDFPVSRYWSDASSRLGRLHRLPNLFYRLCCRCCCHSLTDDVLKGGEADIKSGPRGGAHLNPSVKRIRAPGGPDKCWAERQHPSLGGTKTAEWWRGREKLPALPTYLTPYYMQRSLRTLVTMLVLGPGVVRTPRNTKTVVKMMHLTAWFILLWPHLLMLGSTLSGLFHKTFFFFNFTTATI